MNLSQLVKRSKNSDRIDFSKILCVNDPDPLVVVKSSARLQVEPIWEKPIDDLEGPLYQEYIKLNPRYDSVFLRRQVARRLFQAADMLPRHLRLILRAGHRPVEVQLNLLNSLVAEFRSANPKASHEQALEFARTYVSDPSVKLPPHCCGAAVDVDIVDIKSGRLVDFGCPVNTDSEVAFLHSKKLNKSQRANRMILLQAMLQAGFASCYSEWWHFSYGDQVWAYFYKRLSSLYGIVKPKL